MAAPTEPEAIPADVLEPCPFCGGEAKIIEGEECAYVQCVDVKMHRALWFDGDNNAAGEVAEQWNRRASRAPSSPDAEMVRVLRDARAIVESDMHAAEESGDGDWLGMSRQTLNSIDALLSKHESDQS